MTLILAGLLMVVTMAVYCRVITHDFINFDDDMYVTDNLRVQRGLTLENIRWAFAATDAANWHPVTWLSHMLDCTLFGARPTATSVGMHHLVSVLFHATNAALLFLVLTSLTGAPWRSAMVGALFALHPLHVESVAWISERKDVLSTLFGLLAILNYANFVRSRHWGRYALLLLCFALSLMSKPMLVTLPCVLLLLDVWPLRRVQWLEADAARQHGGTGPRPQALGWLIVEKIPLLAMAAVSSWVTVAVQARAGAVQSLERIDFSARLNNAAVSYVQYMLDTFWPSGLAILYPHAQPRSPSIAIAAILALIIVTAVAIGVFRRAPHVLIGWLWYLGTLVPVIGLVQVGSQARADRYTYIPLVGLFVALIWSVPTSRPGRAASFQWQAIVASVVLILVAACTVVQLSHWKNGLTLFQHAVNVTTSNAVAHANLGSALARRDRVGEAMEQYRVALSLSPRYSHAAKDLGSLLLNRDRLDEAVALLQRAIDVQPEYAEAHSDLGAAYFRQGRVDLAIEHLSRAVQTKPDYVDAHFNLAIAYRSQNQLNQAIEHLRQAVRINPRHIEAHVHLVQAYGQLGDSTRAIEEARAILGLLPDNPGPMMSLAQMLLSVPDPALRDAGEALQLAQRAGELTGRRDPRILNVLAQAQARTGDVAGAAATAQAALDLAQAHNDPALASELQRRVESYRAGRSDEP